MSNINWWGRVPNTTCMIAIPFGGDPIHTDTIRNAQDNPPIPYSLEYVSVWSGTV